MIEKLIIPRFAFMLNFVPMTDPTAFSWLIHGIDLNTYTNPCWTRAYH